MDGTLVDSGEYHFLAWREIMVDYGLDITYEQFVTSFGQRNDTVLRGWLGANLADADIATISYAKESRYRELITAGGIALLPGIAERILQLQQAGWLQAIASAAPGENVVAIMSALKLDSVMTTFVSAEDVQRGKPDPEVFLRAAERLGVEPAHCIVVEDAPAGVEAARRAKMRVIAVGPNHATLPADYAAQTLADLPADVFEQLYGAETRITD
jgi:HAD superfamily hydrolase (TIGR01509 family)